MYKENSIRTNVIQTSLAEAEKGQAAVWKLEEGKAKK